MVIRINNQEPSDLYVGSQPVQKVYRGAGLVWSAAPIITGDEPPSSGSGIAGPASNEWLVADGEAVTGDIMNIDVLVDQEPPNSMYLAQYYEVAVKNADGAIEITELPWGPWTNKQRRLRCAAANSSQRVWVRTVFQYRNQIQFSPPSGHEVQPGDEVVQVSTGATANVVKYTPRSRGWLIMGNIDDTWSNDLGNITVAGHTARQNSYLHPTQDDEVAAELRSEWSDPVDVTTSTKSASVTASATKTTCLQGEAVILTVDTNGFDALMDTHDLHFEWSVDKAGEQGKFQALDGDPWESEFGTSQNNRCQGFSRVWAFSPNTTGPVDVSITVRDRSGNVASDTITLTAVHPIDQAGGGFADADVYVLSDTQRAVPGASGIPGTPGSIGGNYFDDYQALVDALPSTGEALILFDTNGASGPSGEQVDARHKAADRFAVMPYNDDGVGVEAGALAHIDFCLRSNSNVPVFYGMKITGPYDASNPYSISERTRYGIQVDSLTALGSHVRCEISGWEYSYFPGRFYVLVDCKSFSATNFDLYQPDPNLHAIVGSTMWHHPESWTESRADRTRLKGESTPPITTDHGNYRASRRDGDSGISKCSFFTCTGWAGVSQPTLRWFGGGMHYPYIVHHTELRMEQRASAGIGTTSASPGNFDAPQDVVMDKIVFYAATPERVQFGFSVGPLTLRNARFVFPDSRPTSIGAAGNSMFSFAKSGAAGQMPQMRALKQRIVLENITAVSLISDRYFKPTPGYHTSDTCQFISQDVVTNWTNVITRNNLFHVKHQTVVGDTPNDTGPFDETLRYTPIFQAEHDWNDTCDGLYVYGDESTAAQKLAWNLDPANGSIDPSVGLPSTVTATFEPRSGSSAYRTATDSIPYDDILSRVRPTNGTASKGAYDPLAT